jgi:cytochrome c oxidase cbb3-type subunit 2
MPDTLAPRAQSNATLVAGLAATTATYVYFLLFAQFGFVSMLEARLASADAIRMAMAAMGIAGLAASLATGALLGRVAPHRLLPAGLVACALTALLALAAQTPAALLAIAALTGISTAVVTVTLAASLRDLLRTRRFGLKVGVATGLAYFICNIPRLFAATPELRAVVPAALCIVAALALVAVRQPEPETMDVPRPALTSDSFRGLGFAAIVLSFLALVWLDSAAFRIIQETTRLKADTWGSDNQQLMLGAIHFAAAALAGWLIDRGFFSSQLFGAFTLFVVAFGILQRAASSGGASGPIYAIGISAYSVALVAYPSYGGDGPGLVPRRWRAALLYGVAGWIGSALGVGMAQDLHRIPPAFIVSALCVLVVGAAFRHPAATAGIARNFGLTLAMGLAGAVYFAALPSHPGGTLSSPVERGRAVYIAEGCINCHSQYVRRGTRDETMWGPFRPVTGDESPPLLGNRRQGPDLRNAGNRRSATWHALHLADPNRMLHDSRMPSYAYLAEDGRDSDLVAYLASLGNGSGPQHYAAALHEPVPAPGSGDAGRGAPLFARFCSPCHGTTGHGDGPLAPDLGSPATNLTKGPFWFISWGPGAPPEEEGIARAIRFGIAGTSMPGHEYLSDRDVADLVAAVQRLRGKPPASGERR